MLFIDKIGGGEFEISGTAPVPSDFIFYFDKGFRCVYVTPVSYWRDEAAQYDQHLGHVLSSLTGHILSPGNEVTESTFLIPSEKLATIEKELTALGFQYDSDFEDLFQGEAT